MRQVFLVVLLLSLFSKTLVFFLCFILRFSFILRKCYGQHSSLCSPFFYSRTKWNFSFPLYDNKENDRKRSTFHLQYTTLMMIFEDKGMSEIIRLILFKIAHMRNQMRFITHEYLMWPSCKLFSSIINEVIMSCHRYCELRTVQLAPLVALQVRVIQQLLDRDINHIFDEPVDLIEVTFVSIVSVLFVFRISGCVAIAQ